MDINHIQLPATAIASLYTTSLVDTGEITSKEILVTEKDSCSRTCQKRRIQIAG